MWNPILETFVVIGYPTFDSEGFEILGALRAMRRNMPLLEISLWYVPLVVWVMVAKDAVQEK